MSTGNWVTGANAANTENRAADGFAIVDASADIAHTPASQPWGRSQAPAASADADNRVDKRKTRAKLDSAQEVRFELAKLYRQARNGKIDVGDASKLAHMLQVLSRVIETSDIERRLEELEARGK
ncbi:hypothetical protein PQQ87_08960 [Paraburkholderia nemoris]|uniref:hypothetical protein n=1 Tax=Paraburkholderia nemoris TaxID=2793076 RepID=UPI0038B7DE29